MLKKSLTMQVENIYQDIKICTAKKADDNYSRHSEASIIELANGTLFMVWKRHNKGVNDAHDSSSSSLVFTISI